MQKREESKLENSYDDESERSRQEKQGQSIGGSLTLSDNDDEVDDAEFNKHRIYESNDEKVDKKKYFNLLPEMTRS